jgi:bifunctional DNA-binding transcriptional regulator/antitoxin component of YhaV-PrlF toxin-antitoxin module
MTKTGPDQHEANDVKPLEIAALKPVRVNVLANGKLVLPVEVRRVLGLEVGDALYLTVTSEGVISLVSVRLQVLTLRGKYKNTLSSRPDAIQTSASVPNSTSDQNTTQPSTSPTPVSSLEGVS